MKKSNRFFLLISSVLLTCCVILFALLVKNSGSVKLSLVFSGLISVIGGAFASIIVSWSVELGNIKRQQKEKEIISVNVLLPTYKTLVVFYLNFARLGYSLFDNLESKNIKSWIEDVISLLQGNVTCEQKKTIYVSLNAACNNLNNRKHEIMQNRISMLLHETTSNDFCYALCDVVFVTNQLMQAIEQNDDIKVVNLLKEISTDCLELSLLIVPKDYYDLTREISRDDFWSFMSEPNTYK